MSIKKKVKYLPLLVAFSFFISCFIGLSSKAASIDDGLLFTGPFMQYDESIFNTLETAYMIKTGKSLGTFKTARICFYSATSDDPVEIAKPSRQYICYRVLIIPDGYDYSDFVMGMCLENGHDYFCYSSVPVMEYLEVYWNASNNHDYVNNKLDIDNINIKTGDFTHSTFEDEEFYYRQSGGWSSDKIFNFLYSDLDLVGLPYDKANYSIDKTPIYDYLKNGNRGNVVMNGASFVPAFDSDNLYFKDYNFLFVDSSKLKDMYCTFEYSFPDSLDLNDVYIDVDTTYDLVMEPHLLSSFLSEKKYHYSSSSEFQFTPNQDNSLGLGAGKNSFRINVNDTQSIKNYKSEQNLLVQAFIDLRKEERDILGNKNLFVSLLTDGVSADYRTTKSQLVFKLTVCKGNTRGKSYYLYCDLLGNGTFVHSTTPDENGNEQSDSDIKYTGKYFNDPKDDNFGNTQNNYSYVPPDIDIAVNVDSTTGQPTVNTNENNIIFPSDLNIKFHDDDLYYDISSDDYNGVIDNLTNLTDFSEDNKETYGFLHDIYAALPTPLVILMASGLSGIILVSFIKILRG